MSDMASKIAAHLNIILDGAAVCWRTTLPAGFDNTIPTLVVTTQAVRSHQTGATRGVEFQVRVYGGDNKNATVAQLAEDVIAALNGCGNAGYDILRFGDMSYQQLPPEPVTGWPSCLISGRCRAN